MSLGPRVIEGPTEGARSKENTMAPGPPSWIRPPLASLSPFPPKFLHLEKDASDGTNDPIRLEQSDHGLYKGYQELMRQNGRRERQMEADGAEGQSLPEQGKDVWRRQQRRRRESAFTSGSRFSLHPGLPPSLMRARRLKEQEDGTSTVV